MEASPAWGDLPLLVVGEILLRLPSLTDRVRCAAVCRHWKAAAEAEAPRLTYLALAEAEAMAKAWGALPRVARMAQDPSLSDASAGADAAPPRPWVEILGRLVAHAEAEAVDGEEAKAAALRMAREVVDLLSHADADESPTDEAEVAALQMARKLLDRLLSQSHAAATEEVNDDAEMEALSMLRVVLRRLISLAESKLAAAGADPDSAPPRPWLEILATHVEAKEGAGAAAPPWADLPYDILFEIFVRVPTLADFIQCAGVCLEWNHAARECPEGFPFLFMPSGVGKATLLSLLDERRISHVTGPELVPRARFFGSYTGRWVAGALDNTSDHVFVRFDNNRRTIPIPDMFFNGGGHELYVHAMALSTSPMEYSNRGYIAAAITSGDSKIAFWLSGTGEWVLPNEGQTLHGPVEDVSYFSTELHSGFYFLHGDEQVSVFVPDLGAAPVRMRSVQYLFYARAERMVRQDQRVAARYLVVSRGQLFMLRRYISIDQLITTWFDVFALEGERTIGPDLVAASWRKCTILTGQVFFLSRGCSRALEVGFCSGPLWICFLDDTRSFRDMELLLDVTMEYPCSDVGCICHLHDGVRLFLPEGSYAGRSPLLWYF